MSMSKTHYILKGKCLTKHIGMLKCSRCRFRNKTRREWCYYYDRRIIDMEKLCKIDPDRITQHQLDKFRRRRLKSKSTK